MSAVPPAGRHGGDGAAVARALGLDPDDMLDLSMSLNPFAPDVVEIAARHLGSLGRYPDPTRATAALAEGMGVDRERLVLTNGGSEAISLVAGVMGGTVVSEPEFALHPRQGDGPRWRTNPHSPTGVLAADDERVDVWDEAFYPLAVGEWTRGDRDTVVVGSLTKVFACPGIRLGYVLADDADRLTAAQPQWSVSTLAHDVLPELLSACDLPGWRDAIRRQRADLARVLAEHGIATLAGDGPWVLASSPGLREQLAPHGVLVRDCTSFGLPGWARVGVPDDSGMERLVSALDHLEGDPT